jgi:hypothetical protein
MDSAPSTVDIKKLSDDDLAETFVTACRIRDEQDLHISRLAAEFARRHTYDDAGFVSPIDWIRFNCHMTSGAAANSVAVGEVIHRLPMSIKALNEGNIGFAHVTSMARTAEAVGDRFDEAGLIEKARENSPGKFYYICTHYRHAADAKRYAEQQAELVQMRRLKLSPTSDGALLLSGVFDSEGGAALRTALEPLARKSGARDHRERDHRMADALVELSIHALDAGFIPQHGSQRTHLMVTASLETLRGLPGAPAADMELSLPISSKMVERLACDASITRIVLGSDSMVIDVGRAKRVVSGPARKALKARDGHCTWPGCERPATWSSAHHLVHWIHGGTNELENLALLCFRHHWMVHEGSWQLVRGEEGRMLAIPPTINFGSPALGPD